MARQPFGGTGKPQAKGKVNNPVKWVGNPKGVQSSVEVPKGGKRLKKGKC